MSAFLITLLLALMAMAQAADTSAVPALSDVDKSWEHPLPKGQPQLIALTFDDGPVPGKTEMILNALKAAKWSATFCVIGRNVAKHPELAKRMVAEGHELAGHSWSHLDMKNMKDATMTKEVGDGIAIIKTTTGAEVRWYRAPNLHISPAQRQRIHDEFHCGVLGMTLSLDDWHKQPPGAITKRLLGDLPHGSVVLGHETSAQTPVELPAIITELSKRGYRSVTVSQLQKALNK